MGISNDWQNIDNLTYTTVSNIRIMTETSVQEIADAIGWEVVNLGDYVQDITLHGVTVAANLFYLLKPPADIEGDYNTGILPFYHQSYSNSTDYGQLIIELSTGQSICVVQATTGANVLSCFLLRPTSTGGFAIRYYDANSVFYTLFDKFYNPKSEKTHWGIFYCRYGNPSFCDLWTGLYFNYSPLNYYIVSQMENFVFCAIKKFTAISSDGVYNAKTIYRAYVDYSNANKTIELGGVKYRGMVGSYIPFYIPLAE